MVRRSLMCSQLPSSSCASKVRAPGACALDFGQPGADLRHAADFDHGLVGCARRRPPIRQLVQALEVRIAEHQAVVGIPQHEGFGNGLDRVAQPQVGFDGLLGEALLFGDVDGDADQMQAAIAAAPWLSSQRTRSQIQWPSVCCMRKLWSI